MDRRDSLRDVDIKEILQLLFSCIERSSKLKQLLFPLPRGQELGSKSSIEVIITRSGTFLDILRSPFCYVPQVDVFTGTLDIFRTMYFL